MGNCYDIGQHMAEVLLAAIGAIGTIAAAYFAYLGHQQGQTNATKIDAVSRQINGGSKGTA